VVTAFCPGRAVTGIGFIGNMSSLAMLAGHLHLTLFKGVKLAKINEEKCIVELNSYKKALY
jgi:hypothetical protein